MPRRTGSALPKATMALFTAIALFFTLAVHSATARFAANHFATANAKAARFDVTVTAPSGITPQEQGGSGNEIVFYTAGTTAAYTFVVANNSDVSITCTASATGDAAYTLTPASFPLAIGESQTVTLELTGASDLTQTTTQQLALSFLLEQTD